MGVKHVIVEEAWDDFIQSQIMASKNFGKDRAIRCSLLSHILWSDIRSRMVDCIRDGIVIFRNAEAYSYLSKYDDYVKNLILVIHLGSVMPARGTELSTYKILHGRSSKRNIFLLGKNVFFSM